MLSYVAQAIYLVIFAAVAVEALRRRRKASVDIALFFGAAAVTILYAWAVAAFRIGPSLLSTVVSSALILLLPYLLLRLVDDFSRVPRWLMFGTLAITPILIVGLIVLEKPLPGWFVGIALVYLVGLFVYDGAMFAIEASRNRGVTRRRMQSVGVGSAVLALSLLIGTITTPLYGAEVTAQIVPVLQVFSGLFYLAGFAPPTALRRFWQEPELRAFLSRAAQLPRLAETIDIVREIEEGAARTLGAPQASVALWDPVEGKLKSEMDDTRLNAAARVKDRLDGVAEIQGRVWMADSDTFVSGRAFTEGRPIFVEDAAKEDPAHADVYRAFGAHAVLAAPIVAGERRIGLLTALAPRAPIFADSDLELLQLLADQAAVVLESRALIDEAARVKAREETTRLKDDFLASAAHDLRTPLTTLLGQAQFLERRARRDELHPVYQDGLGRLVGEAQRLGRLVHELLDASRAERGQLLGARESVDVVSVAQEAAKRRADAHHPVNVSAVEALVGEFDLVRVEQLLDNLIENAVKYSPDGGDVDVRLWNDGGMLRIGVSDSGIGVPMDDMPYLFERYHRGNNVDDRRFAGMGLGLFICRGIAEEHGGRIWAESTVGRGTTFHVSMPLVPPSIPVGTPSSLAS